MRHKVSADLTVDTNAAGFREVMRSAGVQSQLRYEATRAKLRAEAVSAKLRAEYAAKLRAKAANRAKPRAEDVSGLIFGSGVDVYAVNARGWVGASSRNAGLHALQVKALEQALHGV